MIGAPFSAFRSRFFVMANFVKLSVERFLSRHHKKSSTQVGARVKLTPEQMRFITEFRLTPFIIKKGTPLLDQDPG